MPFNRLAKKLQHGFEAKHLWINDSPPALSAADTIPKQIHPKVNQDKRQSHKQQSSHGIFSGGADAAMVLNSIAGFDAEGVFVMVMELMQCHRDLMNDLEAVLDAMFTLGAFVIGANHPHLAGHTTVLGAVNRVLSPIAFAPFEQLPSPARFAPNHCGHEERDIEGFEPTDDGHTVKASVEIKPFDSHSQGMQHCQQVSHRRH